MARPRTDIVLVALNAKYIHSSFGLRYLLANLGELAPRARLDEFTIHEEPEAIAAAILGSDPETRPRIVGLGVYVWNAQLASAVVARLRTAAPEVILVLGGPEVSHEIEAQPIAREVDYVIQGEADLAFADLARRCLDGAPPPRGIQQPPLPELAQLASPYPEYREADVAHRVVYVEASRGCPFRCQFCLSSLDKKVRAFPLAAFLRDLDELFARGVRHFKFVDRTFNLDLERSRAILDHCLALAERDAATLFHFEMIPDRLPDALREPIAAFAPGTLQFEVGIQTFDPEVAARIERRQDPERIASNLTWLRESTGVHVHADLIVGLPGEGVASFAAGFDRLYALRPHEIQVGILKRLRGTPIQRHDVTFAMVYDPLPPYALRHNRDLSADEMRGMTVFAEFWDRLANRGHYRETMQLLLADGSPFARFRAIAAALHAHFGRTHGIPAPELAAALFGSATRAGHEPARVARAMLTDHHRAGRDQIPAALRPFLTDDDRHRLRQAREARGPGGSSGRGDRGHGQRQRVHGS